MDQNNIVYEEHYQETGEINGGVTETDHVVSNIRFRTELPKKLVNQPSKVLKNNNYFNFNFGK